MKDLSLETKQEALNALSTSLTNIKWEYTALGEEVILWLAEKVFAGHPALDITKQDNHIAIIATLPLNYLEEPGRLLEVNHTLRFCINNYTTFNIINETLNPVMVEVTQEVEITSSVEIPEVGKTLEELLENNEGAIANFNDYRDRIAENLPLSA